MKGVNSIRRRCLYNNNPSVYSLEYLKQFFDKYQDEPKFFRVGLVDGDEGTAKVIKYSDDILFDFFDKFERMDTLIILYLSYLQIMDFPYLDLIVKLSLKIRILKLYYQAFLLSRLLV
jgi:hypothetical protein